jgi:hypothetical protein
MNIQDPSSRLVRWSLKFQGYEFDIVHRKGILHSDADALSRPVLVNAITNVESNADEPSAKSLDLFEDNALLHFLRFGSHVTTLKRIQERFYWRSLAKDVEKFIQKCGACKREHRVLHFNHPALANQVISIFHRIGMDLNFGFPEVDGCSGFLNIVEYLSGYLYTVPIKSKTDSEIASHVWTFICIFGPPYEILTDQGNEFNNNLLNYLLKKVNVHHLTTSAYNPRVNGKVERYNPLIADAMRKCMDTEHDKTKWPEYLSFVTLAFNSKVHTRTGFTPYEIVFGRRMNAFESWSAKEQIDETESLSSRAIEIKDLVENKQDTALERIRNAQKLQTKQQDRHQNVQVERLEPGTVVYVKTMGIQSKLAPKYRGPFRIIEVTKNGNYILENTLNERMADTYPLHRLKVIKDGDEEFDQVFRVQKIIKHRQRGDDYEYLVKWQNQSNKHNSWEPKQSFQEMDLITKYWAKLKPTTEPTRAQPQRKATKKVNQLSLLQTVMMLFLILVPIVCASNQSKWITISDEFFYCEKPSTFTSTILDVDHNCRIKPESVNPNVVDPNIKRFHIIASLSEQIKGQAWSCSKESVSVTTHTNFFGAESTSSIVEPIKLNTAECIQMTQSKKCGSEQMTCEDEGCEFDGTPKVDHKWLTVITERGYKCKMSRRLITAKKINDKLFDDADCVASDNECEIGNTLFIWRPDIIHKCPYSFVQTIGNVEIENNIVSSDSLAFEIVSKEFCEPCNMTVYSTKEGLLLTESESATNLNRATDDIRQLHELMLAENDANQLRNSKQSAKIQNEICEEYRQTLQIIRRVEYGFVRTHDVNGQSYVLFVDNGIVFIPRCVKLDSVEVKPEHVKCQNPRVRVKGDSYGFLNQERVVTSDQSTDCSEIKSILLPASRSVLTVENGKYAILPVEMQQLDVKKLYNIQAINFPHDRLLFAESDTIRLISQRSKMAKTYFGKSKNQRREQNSIASTWNDISAGTSRAIGSMRQYGYAIIILVLVIFAAITAIAIHLIVNSIKRSSERKKFLQSLTKATTESV